jgi:hypothetical protein
MISGFSSVLVLKILKQVVAAGAAKRARSGGWGGGYRAVAEHP